MNYKAIHPFPARMAPEIAFDVIKGLPKNSTLLDPMMGSGTSLRIGLLHNYNCIGIDVDPLAILIAKVSNTFYKEDEVNDLLGEVLKKASNRKYVRPKRWDDETEVFAKFWFADTQLQQLSILSKVINKIEQTPLKHFFQVALSKCIITKDKGASLARDVSHAKPHRIKIENDYKVFIAFQENIKVMLSRSLLVKPKGTLQIFLDDARNLTNIAGESIDCIITSPPYLHAVDYFRGHRLSLIWMDYTLADLRKMRAKSIGIQKKPDTNHPDLLKPLLTGVIGAGYLPENKHQHLNKYAYDCFKMVKETCRVLKKRRKATVVIADAFSSGVFINNTSLIKNAAKNCGLQLINQAERSIPANKRYLPPPEYLTNSDLDKRMKTEAILTFIK